MTQKKSTASTSLDKAVPDVLVPVPTKSTESRGSPASSSSIFVVLVVASAHLKDKSCNPTVVEAMRRKSERLAAEKLIDAALTSPLPLLVSTSAPVTTATPMKLVAVTPLPSDLKPSAPVTSCSPATATSAAGNPPPSTILPHVVNLMGKEDANFVLNDNMDTNAAATSGSNVAENSRKPSHEVLKLKQDPGWWVL